MSNDNQFNFSDETNNFLRSVETFCLNHPECAMELYKLGIYGHEYEGLAESVRIYMRDNMKEWLFINELDYFVGDSEQLYFFFEDENYLKRLCGEYPMIVYTEWLDWKQDYLLNALKQYNPDFYAQNVKPETEKESVKKQADELLEFLTENCPTLAGDKQLVSQIKKYWND